MGRFGWGPKVYVEKVYVLFPSPTRFRKHRNQSRSRPKMAPNRKLGWPKQCLHNRGTHKGGSKGGNRTSSCQVAGDRATGANRRHSIANHGLI